VECKISGDFRWREIRGFGPFKREVWSTEPFSCVVSTEDARVSPIDELKFGCVRAPKGYVVSGSIKGVECIFDEFRYGEPRTRGTFTMISIANIEVRGDIEIVGGPVALMRAHGFAA